MRACYDNRVLTERMTLGERSETKASTRGRRRAEAQGEPQVNSAIYALRCLVRASHDVVLGQGRRWRGRRGTCERRALRDHRQRGGSRGRGSKPSHGHHPPSPCCPPSDPHPVVDVQVSRGKTRFRLVLEEGLTFGGLKKKLERISRVAGAACALPLPLRARCDVRLSRAVWGGQRRSSV